VLSVFSSVAALFLGLLALAQGMGKAMNMKGYEEGLAAFEFFPRKSLPVISKLWMLLEIFGGFLLTLASAAHFVPKFDVSRVEFPGAVGLYVVAGLTLAYTIVNGVAWARRLPIANCTCFGTFFPQRLGLSVMLQDLGGMVWAGLLIWLRHRFAVG
jgi:hypothetical protein